MIYVQPKWVGCRPAATGWLAQRSLFDGLDHAKVARVMAAMDEANWRWCRATACQLSWNREQVGFLDQIRDAVFAVYDAVG